MMKSTKAMAIALAVGLGFNALANAAERTDECTWKWSPLGIGLAAPIQLPFTDSDICGLRFGGFFGGNADVYGLDVGIAELAVGRFAGLQGAALSWTEGNVYGLQASALANVVGGNLTALQLAPLNVVWGDAVGVQLGAVNYGAYFTGVQLGTIVNWNAASICGLELGLVNANQDAFRGCAFGGLVNYAERATGFQCGLVNVSYDVTGFQLGLVNACDNMHGCQLGLVNLICNSKLPIMVVANAWF